MTTVEISRRHVFASGALAMTAGAPSLLRAQPRLAARFDAAAIDALVDRFSVAFDIPGFAVAIVGATPSPYLKGYGVRTLGQPDRVDAHTRFGIGSNTKAFTCAALAILVDEGKLGWDDPVTRHLPEFRMADPAVTQLMIVRDLLVHRSGLPLGAGDLLFFPDTNHTAADTLRALPYLKLERPFRAGYAYDNILYIVAGLLIERVSGRSWRDFVAERLFRPMGMNDAVPSRPLLHTANVAGRHGRRGGAVNGLGPMTVVQPQGENGSIIDAAGGINCSVSDVADWLRTQLGGGVAPDGHRIWSKVQAAEMWKPQTITRATEGPTPEDPVRPVLEAYALGWFVQDYRGERLISHSGGLIGQVTQTAMLPRRGLGVAIFSNAESSTSGALRDAILDELLDAPRVDGVALHKAAVAKRQAELLAAGPASLDTAPSGGPSLPPDAYVGRYRDPWYGDVVVSRAGPGLAIAFLPAPAFHGPLQPWGPDTFRTRFPPGAGENALVRFLIKDGRVDRITMKAFSPLADFSFDFQHLDFRPVR